MEPWHCDTMSHIAQACLIMHTNQMDDPHEDCVRLCAAAQRPRLLWPPQSGPASTAGPHREANQQPAAPTLDSGCCANIHTRARALAAQPYLGQRFPCPGVLGDEAVHALQLHVQPPSCLAQGLDLLLVRLQAQLQAPTFLQSRAGGKRSDGQETQGRKAKGCHKQALGLALALRVCHRTLSSFPMQQDMSINQ